MLANGMRLNDRCAPRGALSYRRFSRRELEGRFLGPMAYPVTERFRGPQHARKPAAGLRCQGRRAGEDPRDMAKAVLLESQSPEDASSHPPERHPKPVPVLPRV